MTRAFQRLIRFIGSDNLAHYGDAILPHGQTDANYAKQAYLIKGDPFGSSSTNDPPYTVTDTKLDIKKLLVPIDWENKPLTVRCLGLNYIKHAKECNSPLPKFPILFFKPRTALAGPSGDLVVPKFAQQVDTFSTAPAGSGLAEVDYEVELVIVIGKAARDVPVEKALEYVAGYTAGNDYSHRVWQMGRGGGQWNVGKMFDGWAPIGPAIVSSSIITNPQTLRLTTKLNGEIVQDSDTSDQIFSVAEAVSFLSQGSTLLPGDLIFTGTPSGVILGKTPQEWLKHGDKVEVEIENIGKVSNTIVYEKTRDGSKL